jgi:hypothetical protein
LKQLQQLRRRHTQTRHQIVQELRRLTQQPAPDEQALRARLKALADHDAAMAEDLRRAYANLDELLDAQQQARFRIFEEQMERRKLDLLMRARSRAVAPEPKPRR